MCHYRKPASSLCAALKFQSTIIDDQWLKGGNQNQQGVQLNVALVSPGKPGGRPIFILLQTQTAVNEELNTYLLELLQDFLF